MNISKEINIPKFLKPVREFPEKLIYNSPSEYLDYGFAKFTIFSTKKSEFGKSAVMYCFPAHTERDSAINVPSLYIQFLSSNCSGLGFGTAMLNFARSYSKKVGCEGRFHLTAHVGIAPSRVPHIFYRKYGMSTNSPKVNKKLDRFIKRGKDATYKDFKNIEMFYPPLEPKIKTLWKSVFSRFSYLFD